MLLYKSKKNFPVTTKSEEYHVKRTWNSSGAA